MLTAICWTGEDTSPGSESAGDPCWCCIVSKSELFILMGVASFGLSIPTVAFSSPCCGFGVPFGSNTSSNGETRVFVLSLGV